MQKWYPDGLDMSLSLPALPMTGWAIYSLVSLFGVNFDLMTFCAVLPAFIAAIACIIIYFVGKDMGGRTVGLFAALFLALAPSFLQRSSLGFFDTEVPGVIGLILFVFFFLRSLDGNRSLRASLAYSLGCRCCFSLLHCRLGSSILYHWSLCPVRFHTWCYCERY